MTVTLNPYLNFKGNARDAITFYGEVFGATPTINTFKELGAQVEPGEEDLVMHSDLSADNGIRLMASDAVSHVDYRPGTNFSVSLSGPNEDDAELRGYWDKLAEGGTVLQPLEVAPWGDAFGMVTDKFGITWLFNIAGKPAEG